MLQSQKQKNQSSIISPIHFYLHHILTLLQLIEKEMTKKTTILFFTAQQVKTVTYTVLKFALQKQNKKN